MKILYALAVDEEAVISDDNYYRETLQEIKELLTALQEEDIFNKLSEKIFKVTIEEVA